MIPQPPPTLPDGLLEDPLLELRRLGRGVRAFCVIITFFCTCANLPITLAAGGARNVFADMLPDQSLPLLTSLVLTGRPLFVLLALLLPVASLVVVFTVRRHDHALYILTALVGYSMLQCGLIWVGLTLPIITIFQQLSAVP